MMMARSWFAVLLIGLLTAQFLHAANGQFELTTDADKLSYWFGWQIALNLQSQEMDENVEAIVKDIKAVLDDTSEKDINDSIGTYFGHMIKNQDVVPNFEILAQAVKDTLNGNPYRFSQKDMELLVRLLQSNPDVKTR